MRFPGTLADPGSRVTQGSSNSLLIRGLSFFSKSTGTLFVFEKNNWNKFQLGAGAARRCDSTWGCCHRSTVAGIPPFLPRKWEADEESGSLCFTALYGSAFTTVAHWVQPFAHRSCSAVLAAYKFMLLLCSFSECVCTRRGKHKPQSIVKCKSG